MSSGSSRAYGSGMVLVLPGGSSSSGVGGRREGAMARARAARQSSARRPPQAAAELLTNIATIHTTAQKPQLYPLSHKH